MMYQVNKCNQTNFLSEYLIFSSTVQLLYKIIILGVLSPWCIYLLREVLLIRDSLHTNSSKFFYFVSLYFILYFVISLHAVSNFSGILFVVDL